MIKKIFLVLALPAIMFSGSLAILPVGNADAANVIKDVCQKRPNAAVCKDNSLKAGNSNPLFGPSGILTRIISVMSIVIGIAAVIMIMYGGLKFITSGSNPQDVAKAREVVLYAVVGLLVAGMAQAIVRFFLNELPS